MTGHSPPGLGAARSSWGGPADMSWWEALMWRAEGDLRTRSTGVLVEILDRAPEWERLRAAHERLTLRVPRLRERVIDPLLPLVPPAWSPDPHFDLDYHLQRIRVPGDGSNSELFELAAAAAARPLDPNRPPWEATLVTGLRDGRAGYLLKLHHSLTDGLGLIQLLSLTHGRGPEREEPDTSPLPPPRPVETPVSLLAGRLPGVLAGAAGSVARGAVRTLGRVAADPVGTAVDTVRFGASLRRVLAPPDVERSPVLNDDGTGYRLIAHDVPLERLKAAGRAAGGTVNDAFLAALLGAFRRFHEHHDVVVDQIPIGMPVSLRTDNDPMGGNRFAGARFAVPVGDPDPRVRIAAIRAAVATARTEPAIGFLDLIAPVLGRLPRALLIEIAGSMTTVSDLQASNLAGIGRSLYLAGARVLRVYPMGPRPGVAAMVTMLSYEGTCCVGINANPDVIDDEKVFASYLRDGFDEVLDLAYEL
ncbi:MULTISPECIES: wax ester/triacylglycerol synthase domain-containing protein [unclassified Frankia]|uniref:wax ester/triacylglycerol synthase domain-containing protein n=1 Tax=unclassified Frankia TaxID=2632575 RepID=UPI002023C161